MNIQVDKNSTIPPFQQIKNQIKAAIIDGRFSSDAPLPSVREISRVTGVALTTAQRVYSELRNEQYVYSQRGRGNFVLPLSERISSKVYVFLPSSSLSFFTKILQGIFATAYQKNWEVVINSLDTDKLLWNEHTIEMLGHAVEEKAGVIFIEEAFGDIKQKCLEAAKSVPFVTVEWRMQGASAVLNDYEQSAFQTVRYLFEQKRIERLLVLKGRDFQYNASEKLKGIYAAARQLDLTPQKELFFCDSDFDAITGYQVTKEFFATNSADAVFCGNDYEAIGVIGALTEMGLLVGKDVRVVGYGDMTDKTTNYFPLTTVSQELTQLGTEAMGQILTLAEGEPPGDTIVPTRFIARNT